jgi:hypothetical protein
MPEVSMWLATVIGGGGALTLGECDVELALRVARMRT